MTHSSTVKTLITIAIGYPISIVFSILLATIPLFQMPSSSLQLVLIFLSYHVFLICALYARVNLKMSFQAIRMLAIPGPIMWFFYPYISLSNGIRWGHGGGLLDERWALLKTLIMNTQYLTNQNWTFLSADLIAVFLFTFSLKAILNGQGFQLSNQNKHDGSGDHNNTARLSDATWATHKDIKAQYSAAGGIVLGELTDPRKDSPKFDPKNRKSWGTQGQGELITLDPAIGNGHTLVVSESSGFKTAGIVIPNILNYTGPILVLDPKCDLYERTADARRAMGFNPIVISKDDGIDPLSILKPLMDEHPSIFFNLAENLIPEGPHATENSQYFRDRALDLLSGLLYHFVSIGDKDVLGSISRILSLPLENLLKVAAAISEDSDHPFVVAPLARLSSVDKKAFESLVRPISNKFKFAEFPDVSGYIQEPEGGTKNVDVLKPDTDVYINVPSRVLKSFSPMVRLIIACILTATQTIEKPDSPSARRLLILDEAKGLGNMDVLELIRDEGRAVGLHLMMIYQTWGQLKKIWGIDAASAWEDSVDTRIIGATQDENKARAIQNIIGKDTVRVRTKSNSRSQRDMEFRGQSSNSYSEQVREVPLITAAEIANFPSHGAIILTRRCKPVLASKAIYFTRPEMKDRVI